MNFSEKDLVDIFWTRKDFWEHLPGRNAENRQLTAHREFALPSQKRCDILIKDKCNRFFWIIEAKVIAGPDAIIQAFEYRDEVIRTQGPSLVKVGFITIAAQFFKEETIFFAKKLGVQCLHLAPLNFKSITVSPVVDFDSVIAMSQTTEITNPIWMRNTYSAKQKRLAVAHG